MRSFNCRRAENRGGHRRSHALGMSQIDCDVAIIGGGPIGMALALALRDSGLNIYLLEARVEADVSTDPRALALSYGSRLLLQRLGIWNDLPLVSAIRNIHISQKNSFGRAVLRADELNIPALGYVLPYHALQTALQQASSNVAITHLRGAPVTDLQSAAEGARITYQHAGREHILNARLAVVADGGRMLEAAHPPTLRDYGQSAVIAHITCTRPLADTAYERFTAQGPIALLPYKAGYELVWTTTHESAQQMLLWQEGVFLRQLHQHFGDRVGEFLTLGPRTTFSLRLKQAPDTIPPHTVLLGNAAQTLHPVAGQGFNLGLRDAWELGQEILRLSPPALGSDSMLRHYRRTRRLDRSGGIHFTDGLVRMFSNDWPLIRTGRAFALSALDILPGVKKFVAKRMIFGAHG
jgi:2-octaprenyl-6-methoxyphenol hydroxylase